MNRARSTRAEDDYSLAHRLLLRPNKVPKPREELQLVPRERRGDDDGSRTPEAVAAQKQESAPYDATLAA
jgi:hypothetical protein